MLGFLNFSSLIRSNNTDISFRSKDMIAKTVIKEVKKDFITSPVEDKFSSKSEIESLAKSNLVLRKMFAKYDLPIRVNIDELEKLREGHLEKTRDITVKIYSVLPDEFKKKVNIFNLQTAALHHDYGKVLIPNHILNKGGKLTPDEREIMQLHSEIGYELLKNKGFNEKVLSLIKYHHQNLHKNGYPCIENDFDFGIEYQILNVADKYTALREERCYKNPFGKYEALEIIAKEVNKGLISQEVFTALIRVV